MSTFQSLAPRQPASLETVHNILRSLVARYRQEEVLTEVRQIPAREAKFRPVPAWVTSVLTEAYRAKGVQELYSHQAATAELVRAGKNVVVVTPTASGKTLCYNLPVLSAVLENADTRALYLFPTKALAHLLILNQSVAAAIPLCFHRHLGWASKFTLSELCPKTCHDFFGFDMSCGRRTT